MAVIPLAPALAVFAASAFAAALPRRWTRALLAFAAVAAMAAVLATRADWEADVRRGVFIASHARGLWLDRAVDLAMASGAVSLAAALRASRAGYAVAAGLSAVALLGVWLYSA